METRDKVKQRRMERVRLLREATEEEHKIGLPLYAEPGRTKSDPEWNRRMEDPEFAWNQKYKMEAARMARESDDEAWQGWRMAPPSGKAVWIKLIISVILFAAIWGMFQIKHPLADKGRLMLRASLTESFDFQAAAAWYEQRFGGSPSFIPSFGSRTGEDAIKVNSTKRTYFVPVPGKIIAPFESSHPWVLLQTAMDAPVYALDTGQVIFAGNKEDTGYTVIIRHPNGMESTYGRLDGGQVEVNDWIKGGEPIGKVSKGVGSSGALCFGISKDGRPLNPTDVIPFD